jgi:NADPH:quinone reductase-like Zn-dependent oxidoreductase
MSATVQARSYNRQGSAYPKSLRLTTQQVSIQNPHDVLIKIHAISLNYRDINILNGTNPWPVKEDGIPCSDAAGEVFAVGDAVTLVKVGDRVTPILDQKNITGDEADRECQYSCPWTRDLV